MARDLRGTHLDEHRLWNTYLYRARLACDEETVHRTDLDITKPRRRVPPSADAFLQAILFTAFALEYGLKRVYRELGIRHRRRPVES